MPENKETKPRYELRRRGKTSYVALWQGKHCLCAICTKTVRGALDAQLILQVMNSHKGLLGASKNAVATFVGYVEGSIGGQAIQQLDAAIASTKPEQESTL